MTTPALQLPQLTESVSISLQVTGEELRGLLGVPAERFRRLLAGEAQPSQWESQKLTWLMILCWQDTEGDLLDSLLRAGIDWSTFLSAPNRPVARNGERRKKESRLSEFLAQKM